MIQVNGCAYSYSKNTIKKKKPFILNININIDYEYCTLLYV